MISLIPLAWLQRLIKYIYSKFSLNIIYVYILLHKITNLSLQLSFQQSFQFHSIELHRTTWLFFNDSRASKNVKCMLHAGGHYIRTRSGSRSSSWSPRGKFLIISHQVKIASLGFFFLSFYKDKNRYFAPLLLLFFELLFFYTLTDVYVYLSSNNGRNWISVSGIVRLANRLFSRLHPRTH